MDVYPGSRAKLGKQFKYASGRGVPVRRHPRRRRAGARTRLPFKDLQERRADRRFRARTRPRTSRNALATSDRGTIDFTWQNSSVDLVRTHTCGALRADDVGAEVVLLGWVHRVRDLGGVTFIDIRDRAGIIAGRRPRERRADAGRQAAAIRVRGRRHRASCSAGPTDTVNPKLATGEVEVLAREIRVLNEAKTPPFQIAEDSPVSEDVRLRYRYLDLRRPRLQRNIGLRHRVAMAIREVLRRATASGKSRRRSSTKSTPEGARDFLVPSRVHAGEFYALPQSPQIFKQILMIAGIDRYFQIVRCFRDEDQRADRQLEFTQVDVEMSFAQPELDLRR